MRTRAELLRALERDRIPFILRESGDGWMIVAPALGARILAAGIGEENLLWTARRFSTRGWQDGGNAGGARTWIAPEGGPHGFFFSADAAGYEVPREVDPGDFRPVTTAEGWIGFRNAFTARAADGASYPIAVTRVMRIEKVAPPRASKGACTARIRFRHEIENAGSAPIDRRVGLWCVVQVPSEEPGTIRIPLVEGAPEGSVHPYFVELPPGVLRATERAVLLKAHGGRKYKIGVAAQAAAGGISFVRPSRIGSDWTFVSLEFSIDPSGVYLDTHSHEREAEGSCGDAVQAYNDPGTGDLAFSEIEAHAPAVPLEPGEQQAFACDLTIASGPERAVRGLAEGVGSRPGREKNL